MKVLLAGIVDQERAEISLNYIPGMLVTRTCPWVQWVELTKPLDVKAWAIIKRPKILSMGRKMLKSNNLLSLMLGFWL